MIEEDVHTTDIPDPQFLTLLRSHLKYLRAADELPLDHPLKPLGLDSMAAVDLLLDLEDTYDVTMPEIFLTEKTFSTARSLWHAVAQLRGEPR